MDPEVPSTDEADLLGWELIAMVGTSYRLRTDRGLRSDALANTAFLESFLTHVRILTEYFMGRRRKDGGRYWKPDTDLVPHDLVSDWTPPEVGAQLDEALPKIDAFLSHLSRRRLDDKEAWGFVGLADTVLKVGATFDEALRSEGSTQAAAFHRWIFLARKILTDGPITPPDHA